MRLSLTTVSSASNHRPAPHLPLAWDTCGEKDDVDSAENMGQMKILHALHAKFFVQKRHFDAILYIDLPYPQFGL